MRMNRYSLHTLAADSSQIDLLSSVIETRFPPYVDTVGTAIDYVLHRSGYRHVATEDILYTLELPLPESHRNIGPVDIRTAVQTIVGQPWQIQENSTQRILWFQRVGAEPQDLIQPPTSHSRSNRQSQSLPTLIGNQSTSPTEWKVKEARTLRENLQDWVQMANWSLEWRSQHDYAITYPATFSGTLVDAIGKLLLHYQNAPIPLAARLYTGNQVLVIEPSVKSTNTQ